MWTYRSGGQKRLAVQWHIPEIYPQLVYKAFSDLAVLSIQVAGFKNDDGSRYLMEGDVTAENIKVKY